MSFMDEQFRIMLAVESEICPHKLEILMYSAGSNVNLNLNPKLSV